MSRRDLEEAMEPMVEFCLEARAFSIWDLRLATCVVEGSREWEKGKRSERLQSSRQLLLPRRQG